MPRYFFNVRAGADLTRDREGAEFPEAAAAHHEAISLAKKAVAEGAFQGRPLDELLRQSFEVRDEAGRLAFKVSFADAARADDLKP